MDRVTANTLPPGWSLRAFGDLGEILKSRGGSKADEVEQGTPVIRYGELYTRHHDLVREFHSFIPEERTGGYTRLRAGDILFAGSGETLEEIGKSAVFLGPGRVFAGGDLLILRPGEGVDPLFVGYASNSPSVVTQKARMGQGSSVMHLYAHNLREVELLLPPLPEQKKIAAILSSVDDAIAATRKVIEQTERLKKGLLQTLMTRGIGHTRFKKTEIGEIPEGWEVVRLGEVASLITKGTTPTTYGHQYVPRGVPFVRVENVTERGTLDLHECKHVTLQTHQALARSRLQSGDLLLSIAGAIGRAALVPAEVLPANVNQALAVVRPIRTSIDPGFLLHAVMGPGVQQQVELIRAGLAQYNLNLKQVGELALGLPPLPEQAAISERIAGILDVLSFGESHLTRLQTLKRGLLQDLLTGRVRVTPD